jgi:hypothetical protein
MSSIRSIDLRFVDELVEFVRGTGYVLDFSDTSFANFFAAELDIDIDDDAYRANGNSKGKRLKCLLQKVDDPTAARVLRALWGHRVEIIARMSAPDPVENAEGRFLSLIARLSGRPDAMQESPAKAATDWRLLASLKEELVAIHALAPQQRGYAFEAFLTKAFSSAGMQPRQPFRNTGEQIDGSFVLDQEVYLLEAKWQATPTPASDLRDFHGKLDVKASWARGLFVSYNGFSADGLTSFGSGKRLVCMEGRDLYDALEAQIPIPEVIRRKIRAAAESGRIAVPVSELFGLSKAGAR